jgi:TonB-linked SusC/RagA family outer membrane protein
MKECRHTKGLLCNSLNKTFLIMRISTLLLIFGILQAHATSMYSQKDRISVSLKEIKLNTALDKIEKESEYYFLYNEKLFDINRLVSINAKNEPIGKILDKLFKDTEVRYAIFDRKIILAPAYLLKGLGSSKDLQQQVIKGRITDATTDEPIVGANIIIEGTQTGVVSDIDGNFSIEVSTPETVLIISSLGYNSERITPSGQDFIDIKLIPDIKNLDEVVVVGYGIQKKVNLTGAVSSIDGDVLENRPITNIGQGLQGAIPNLEITQGFAPGQGSSFNVRGITSINGGGPLVLVDGVVQDPNLLNPNDIESVSVLKDAASSAIYGARAAYGVILITTKHGKKEQKPSLNVNGSYTSTSATNLPEYADSWQYITYMNTASTNAGGSNYFDQRLMDNAKKYYDDPKNNLPVYYDPNIDTDGKYKYCGNTNWTRELYKSGIVKQINASLSGGSQKTSYFVSYGFLQQNGFLKSYDDSYQRHNINMNLSTDVSKWLTLSANTKYTYSFEDHPSGGSNGWSGINTYGGQLKNDLRPLMPVRHPDGTWAGQGSFTNPFAVGAEGGHDQRKVNDLWFTGNIDLHPLKDLSFKVDYTFNPYSWNRDRNSRLFYEYWAEPGKYNIYPWVNPNSIQLENSNDYYNAFNAYLNYSKSFAKNNFKFLVGYNQETKKYKWMYEKREGLIDNDLPVINRATGEDYVDGSITSWATQGIFFRVNYDFAGKYLVELDGRYDGSSKFPKNDRFAFFPSVSAGWRISEESFWEGIKPIINNAKIRGSYGSLGNQAVSGDFPYISSYGINTSTSYMLGGILPVSITSGDLISPSFTWEKVNQWNIGADFEFLRNRLSASLDIYQRKTIGMLTTGTPLPAVLGTGVPNQNAADLKTYGFESILTWKDRVGGFSYNVSFNISDYQSEITKFDNPTGDLGSDRTNPNNYVGKKMNEIWGYEASGLFQSTGEITSSPSQTKIYGEWNPGDVKYADLNGDGEISWGTNTLSDHGDLKIIGNSTPRYQYGIQAGASWKGFDLDIFIQGVAKRDLWLSGRFFGISSEWDVPMKESLDYWTEDNTGARLPRPYINGGHGNRETSTLYLQSGAYLRVKQLSLGYTLPENLSKKAALNKIRIYFTGQNIITLTKLSKLYDPENTNLMGYPVPKSYSVGLNLTF